MSWTDIFKLFHYAFMRDPIKDRPQGGIVQGPFIPDIRPSEMKGPMLRENDFIDLSTDEEALGHLAMRFRDLNSRVRNMQNEIGIIEQDYAITVDRLIKSGKWEEMPPPEDQLPHEHMPESFWQYWWKLDK